MDGQQYADMIYEDLERRRLGLEIEWRGGDDEEN